MTKTSPMSIDLSLERLEKLVAHLPPYTRPTIHIAGTNGKGSVSALLTSILLASHASTSSPPSRPGHTLTEDTSRPLRVGRYNSPHLTSIRDCITIDNIPVSQATYDAVRSKVEEMDRLRETHLSSFEILTVTALQFFEGVLGGHPVDVVVLEVGMGGARDATNIVPSSCILVSALTAVALDHQAFLGDTVAKISREKAGIARPGKAFVLGKQAEGHADDVEGVVAEVVRSAGGTLVKAVDVQPGSSSGPNFSLFSSSSPGVRRIYPPAQRVQFTLPCFPASTQLIHASLPLHGAHQLDNLGTALGVISALVRDTNSSDDVQSGAKLSLGERITPDTVRQGIEDVSWPGRLSLHTVSVAFPSIGIPTDLLVLADGAHNAASAQTLGVYVAELVESTRVHLDASAEPEIDLPITYILALSHSPPKSPHSVLAPLLAHFAASTTSPQLPTRTTTPVLKPHIRIALLPFTPPAGMPWVKPVPSSAMLDAVREILPAIPAEDVLVLESLSLGEAQASARDGDGRNEALERALAWAAQWHSDKSTGNGEKVAEEGGRRMVADGLVVVAGSLYLVADFYRLLETQQARHDA